MVKYICLIKYTTALKQLPTVCANFAYAVTLYSSLSRSKFCIVLLIHIFYWQHHTTPKPCGTENIAVLEIISYYFGGRDLEEEDLHIYVYIV